MERPLQDLKLQPLAIGSLPFSSVSSAMSLVEKDFYEIPFPPQLANISKNEDMIIQLLEGMPSFCAQKPQDFVIDLENEDFLSGLEEFLNDYETVLSEEEQGSILEKYALSADFSHSYPYFEEFIRKSKPKFAKSQITGPFTFSSSINDKNGACIIYDETLRDVAVKHLSLKALWMIRRIKLANPETTAIIFMDEPSISQLGTSAYLSINQDIVISMIKEISDIIKKAGAISAIHCCGKCDWRVPISAKIDIINFDSWSFAQNFSIYHNEIREFLQNGGKIAWGIVPTIDNKILETLSIEKLIEKFEKSIKYLTKSGINEKLILDNSLITSSCGAGALQVDKAQKAMDLVYELSKYLRERF